jgi:hypothetical protein
MEALLNRLCLAGVWNDGDDLLALRTWRTVLDNARRGTSSRLLNQPSASCCRRHDSSNSTTM